MVIFFRGLRSFVFFFFQAEAGIRDAQESRGLGDVYKIQAYIGVSTPHYDRLIREPGGPRYFKAGRAVCSRRSVSYTHLTLPTIYSV